MEIRNRPLLSLFCLLVTAIAISVFLYPSYEHKHDLLYRSHKKPAFVAPKRNVWSELSKREADEIYDFVLTEFSHLNLVKRPKSAKENSVFTVETLRPNKTDAVPYLFGDGEVPERWAKVVLNEQIDGEPYLVYYALGPLPVTKSTRILPLLYPFNSGTNSVRNPIQDFTGVTDFGEALGRNVSDITQALLGDTVRPDDPKGLVCFPRASRVTENGLVLWFQFFRPGLGSGARTLLPQGLYAKIDATGSDDSRWSVGEFFYNGVLYENEDALRAALKDPNFETTPPNLDGPWTETEDFDASPDGRELPPPANVQPYGPRYKLDRKQNYISWFGFEFYISTTRSTGLSLHDIRFKGERVMFELGLQEAMAHYAGDDPMAGGQEFLDAFFGMGANMFELVPGYDCPTYADYLDTQYHMAHQVHELPNSICLFEFTADYLLSRHTAQYSVTASRNTYLTVRSTSTIGNYDYTIDYVFYMDGSIEVKVRASGYIFSAFYAKYNTKDEYGHRIHDAVASSMHDHVINFKADLDVAGPKNDMVRLALEPITKSYPWDMPEVPKRNTMHLVEYAVDEEIGLDWPKNSGEFYLIYSADEKNAWGERKGYRITSGTGMGATPHLTILNSTTLGDSARWAEHDVWVLKHKDTEPRSADPLNYLEPKDPIINFDKMADHESLKRNDAQSDYDGDLVIYFNVGAHHIPHSGDVPNTLMHTSASSVMFVPHNFMDRDPSRESVQGVRLQLKGKNSGGFAGDDDRERMGADLRARGAKRAKKGPHAKYFGATYEAGMKLPLEALEPELESYYRSEEHGVTHLTFNRSAAGVWF